MNMHVKTETLAKFFAGVLSEKEKEKTVNHFSECNICREDFACATHIMEDRSLDTWEPMPESKATRILDKVKARLKPQRKLDIKKTTNKIIEWISDIKLLPTHVQHEYAKMRDREYVKEKDRGVVFLDKLLYIETYFSDLKAELMIEKDDTTFNLNIKVKEKVGELSKKNIRLTLKRKDGGPISRLLKQGHRLIEELPFGNYMLTLSYKKEKKGDYYFHIDETGFKNDNSMP